jgi:anti-sigma regulatory factor (Ser/Thr protein kinase)
LQEICHASTGAIHLQHLGRILRLAAQGGLRVRAQPASAQQGSQMETTTPIRPTRQQQHLRRIALDAGPAAAAEARTEVQAAIFAWDLPVDASVAVLLTSELVTNALRHEAGPVIVLDLGCAFGQLRVDVHDTSRFLPTLVDAPVDAEAGRGLMLVASLSDDWGCYRTRAGKAVFFTLEFQADLGEDGRRAPDGSSYVVSGDL